MKPLNIYYLCHYIPKVADTHIHYVESILRYSKHNIRYLEIANNSNFHSFEIPELQKFDVIMLHHNLNLYGARLSDSILVQLSHFAGLKIYFAQDEYTNPVQCANHLAEIGIDVIFGCASSDWRAFWPEEILPKVDYKSFLPGYAPDLKVENIPLKDRKFDIVYRGSHLGHFYGQLGFEKFEIGKRMKDVANKHDLLVDIEWDRSKQIYGDKWLEFMGSGRVTLATESGASIVHTSASHMLELHKTKDLMLESDSIEEYFKKLEPYRKLLRDDGKAVVATVSQKVFEAVISGTAIVAYEGFYAGVIEKDRHYISLKKDWSNIEEVVEKIKDLSFLTELTKRAHKEIIGSGKYSYEVFVRELDDSISYFFNKRGHAFNKSQIAPHYFSHEAFFNSNGNDSSKTVAVSNDISHLKFKDLTVAWLSRMMSITSNIILRLRRPVLFALAGRILKRRQ